MSGRSNRITVAFRLDPALRDRLDAAAAERDLGRNDGEGLDPRLVDPEEVAACVIEEGPWRLLGEPFRATVARAEWADTAIREGLADLVGDEEEQ